MSKTAKTPLRMCVACRRMLPKPELIRIVKSADGVIGFDENGKAEGRGAYVCKERACQEKCAKSRLFNRAFKGAVPEDIYGTIRANVTKHNECDKC